MERPPTIETNRLALVALLPEDVEALVSGDVERAGMLTGVRFPPGWPNDPEARDGLSWHLRALKADEARVAWRIRIIIERSSQSVVGSINLKGPPNGDGDVEIGWGLVEHCRGRGYAFEAAAAVIAWVVRQPGVHSISATVPDDNHPSKRLAAKLGLVRTGETCRNLPLWKKRLGIPMDRDTQTDIHAIEQMLRRIELAENAGNSDDIADMMADDAVIMVPNQPTQEGKTACVAFVRDVLAGLLEQFNRHITYVSAEARIDGNFAFDRGSFSFTVSPKGGGQSTNETGKYLFLYSRGADRSWKIARAIVSLDDQDGEHEEEARKRTR